MAITVSNISICSVPASTDYFTQMPSGVSDSRDLFSTLGLNIYELSGNGSYVTIFENDILKIEGKADKNAGRPQMTEVRFYDKRTTTPTLVWFMSPSNLRNCYLAIGYDDTSQLAYFLLAGQFYYSGSWDAVSSSYYGTLGGSVSADRQTMYELVSGSQTISYTANGGGATHIAKRTGQLKDLSSYTSDILIVSGGGGGGLLVGETSYSGKEAGGISGSGDNSADQTTGNAFGLGESGTNLSGGGSGLYGGYKGTSGSGYIGNSLLSNKKMVGYNVPTSDAESTKTESVNEASATPVSGKPKSGNGFARIKFLRELHKITMTILASNQMKMSETGDSPIFDEGSSASDMVYDSETESYYFASKTTFHYPNNVGLTVSKLNTYRTIEIEKLMKITNDTYGHDADDAVCLGDWANKVLRPIFSNGYDDASQYRETAVLTNSGTTTWKWTQETPLDSNKNNFHRIKIVFDMENSVIKKVTSYIDGTKYAESTFNQTVNFENVAWACYLVCIDHSYIKEIKITITE